MDIELLIHGVPEGQDFYGIKEERENIDLFYDNSKESVKFVVEIKKQGNNAYCYYSYLRYKGIVGASGRPGAYFGLTLRTDQYYQDTGYIYNLLDMLFKRYIVGTFLVPSGDGYQYTIKNFINKSAEIDKMSNVFIQLMQSTFVPSKLLDIDTSFIHPISSVPKGNIADVSEVAVLSSIKKYSKIVLSPDYEMNIVKEYQKKIQEVESKGGNILAEKDKKIAEKESAIISLNTTITTKNNEITTLKQEIKNKDAEIQQNKQKLDLARLVSSVKEPITALADYFRVKESKAPVSKYGYKNFRLGLLNGGLLLVILIICLISFFRTSNGSTDDVKGLEKQIVTLNATIKSLESDIESKEKTIRDLESQIQLKTLAETSAPTASIALKIDVSGYVSGELSPEKTYIVSIKDGKNNYNGKGKWVLTNAEIKKGKNTDSQITIQPNGKGQVKLDYKAEDGNCKVTPRTIGVSVPTQSGTQMNGSTGKAFDFDIEISPNVTAVKIGNEYTFSISGYDGRGTWAVDGYEQPDNKQSRTITVKAIRTGKSEAVVSYLPENGDKDRDKKRLTLKYKHE